ncbi:MAG TPA: sulfatase-like hydrolase/transferase [Pelobium sp.]|nr:sulfatase-like hydrolase/transferase [Pelobium sp.]
MIFSVVTLNSIFSCHSSLKSKSSIKDKPNIIVILIDDAGYADFGFMGSKDLKTPEIDKLANSGVIFTDAHTSSTVCSPSRAGLITGRYQQRFGFECNGTGDSLGVDVSEITMAATLKNQGYKTIGIGKWHLGDKEKYRPNNRGFDEFYGFLSGSRHYFNNNQDDKPGSLSSLRHNQKHVKFEGYLTDVLGDAAVNYIDQYKKEPFFIYLSFNAVHTPLQAKQEDLDKFKGHPRQMLAAMTWSLDENVGKVMKKLADEKLLENTLVFFLSDNGGANNNQSTVWPLKGWKGNVFEGGHRVPFAMSWKGHLPEGVKSDKLVSSLDIYATALAVTATKNPEDKPVDGVSLIPFTNDGKVVLNHEMLFWRKDEAAAARIGDYKLIRLKNEQSVLYNLKTDIGEKTDISKVDVKKYQEMQKALSNWESKMIDPLWVEEPEWTKITFDIHKALMNNKKPKKVQPDLKH